MSDSAIGNVADLQAVDIEMHVVDQIEEKEPSVVVQPTPARASMDRRTLGDRRVRASIDRARASMDKVRASMDARRSVEYARASMDRRPAAQQAAGIAEFTQLRYRASVEIDRRRSMETGQKLGLPVAPPGPGAKVAPLEKEAKQVIDITAHRLDLDGLAREFKTDLTNGLTSAEAAARFARDGPNQLTPPARVPWFIRLFKHLVGGFQLMMIAGAILCFVVYGLDPTDTQTFWLGIVLVIVVVLTGIFSFYQENKSDAVMEGFKALTPTSAHVIRDGAIVSIDATKIVWSLLPFSHFKVAGDVVKVTFGEKVPADIRILEASNLKVDNSRLRMLSFRLTFQV